MSHAGASSRAGHSGDSEPRSHRDVKHVPEALHGSGEVAAAELGNRLLGAAGVGAWGE